jgi:hypothetical protein
VAPYGSFSILGPYGAVDCLRVSEASRDVSYVSKRGGMMQMSLVLGLVLSVLSLPFGLGYAEAPTAPALLGSTTCALQTIKG